MRTIATAGHVDHGKSTLVRALTGTDPDRLPEEQARGLTIDLGFAFADLPSGARVGFVDVPGHARFLPNMLAGAGAVDLALFVVAADEGWCAQSREHLQILDLLGATGGVIAVTKRDRVEPDRLARVVDDVRARTHGTVLEGATIVPCDARRGDGIAELRGALDELLAAAGPPTDRGRPRLWIDRAFSVKGAGTVVTGTLEGGELSTGQTVVVIGDRVRTARIRGLESGGHAVDVVEPGARVAVNLADIERSDVARGDVVVVDGQWHPTVVVDGRLWLDGPRPASLATLHAHVGSAKVQARLRIVGDFGRLRLERPVPLVPGDRIVLRDPGPSVVVGALEVLDVEPGARLDPDRLAAPGLERVFLARAWRRRSELGSLTGLADHAIDDDLARLQAGGRVVASDSWLVRADEHARAVGALIDAVGAGPQPLVDLARTLGLTRDQVRTLAATTSEVAIDHDVVRHRDAVATAFTPPGRAVLDALRAAPFAPPDPRTFVDDPSVLTALVREGAVTKCDDIWFASDALVHAAQLVDTAFASTPALAVSDLRDLFGSSRKYTLAIAGWLDATGVTRRDGDRRVRGAGRVPDDPVS
jgi:selenocysteine-specific elongation factor